MSAAPSTDPRVGSENAPSAPSAPSPATGDAAGYEEAKECSDASPLPDVSDGGDSAGGGGDSEAVKAEGGMAAGDGECGAVDGDASGEAMGEIAKSVALLGIDPEKLRHSGTGEDAPLHERILQGKDLCALHSEPPGALPDNAEMFGFPQEVVLSDVPESSTVFHHFVLTDGEGEKFFGHCCTRYYPLTPEVGAVVRMQVGSRLLRGDLDVTMDEVQEELERAMMGFEPLCLCVFTKEPLFRPMRSVLEAYVNNYLPLSVRLNAEHAKELYKFLCVDSSVLYRPVPSPRGVDAQGLRVGDRIIFAEPPRSHGWELVHLNESWQCSGCHARYGGSRDVDDEDLWCDALRCFQCGQCSKCGESLWGVSNESAAKEEYEAGSIDCIDAPPASNVDFHPLLSMLSPATLIGAVSALLAEQHILVVSDSLSPLTDVIGAMISLIYPLEWPHILVPVLPTHLQEFLEAPIPFLIGTTRAVFCSVPESVLTGVNSAAGEGIVVIDLDEDTITDNFAPMSGRLPLRLTLRLAEALWKFVPASSVSYRLKSEDDEFAAIQHVSAATDATYVRAHAPKASTAHSPRRNSVDLPIHGRAMLARLSRAGSDLSIDSGVSGGSGHERGDSEGSLGDTPLSLRKELAALQVARDDGSSGAGAAVPSSASTIAEDASLETAEPDTTEKPTVDTDVDPATPKAPLSPGTPTAAVDSPHKVSSEDQRRYNSLDRRKRWFYRNKLQLRDKAESLVAKARVSRGTSQAIATSGTLAMLASSGDEDSDSEDLGPCLLHPPWRQGFAVSADEMRALHDKLQVFVKASDAHKSSISTEDAAEAFTDAASSAVRNVPRIRWTFLSVMVSCLKAFRPYLRKGSKVAPPGGRGHSGSDSSGPLSMSDVAMHDVVVGDFEAVFRTNDFVAEQISDDCEYFVRNLCKTLLFACFLQDRIHHAQAPRRAVEAGASGASGMRTDVFDRLSFRKMQLKAWRNERMRRENHVGILHVAHGSTAGGWVRRYVELKEGRLALYSDWRRLTNLESVLRGTAALLSATPRTSSRHAKLRADRKEARDALAELQTSCLKETIDLEPGTTRISIPSSEAGKVFASPYAFQLINETAGTVVSFCTESADDRRTWIGLIKSRLHTEHDRTRMRRLYLDRQVGEESVLWSRDLRRTRGRQVSSAVSNILNKGTKHRRRQSSGMVLSTLPKARANSVGSM